MKRILPILFALVFIGFGCIVAYAESAVIGQPKSKNSRQATPVLIALRSEDVVRSLQAVPTEPAGSTENKILAQAKSTRGTDCLATSTCELPRVVERAALRTAASCGFKEMKLPKDSWVALNFNADGKPDYLINYGKITCGQTPTYFGLTRGSYHELWVSSRWTWKLVLSKEVLDVLNIEPRKDRDVIIASLHPSYCKLKDGSCKQEWRWSGAEVLEGEPSPW